MIIKEYRFQMTQRADGMDIARFGKFEASSRNGASCKLARILVEAGANDAPVLMMRGTVACVRYRSLHWLATKTISEATGHPRMVDWVAFERRDLSDEVAE
ncbi:hypothetical protein [Acetobacter sicerae]|uniref:hypothetical protein n=1 Tax=Acetobacter sicerae TaxID=85325 RepID=UPI00156BD314|nr:hypothetical protein [Acetobacter sicerae]NHN93793.1 hypothetical protein [Acetobacter sicerae]